MVFPDKNDAVIRQKHGHPSTVYLLGTPSSPDRVILLTRDEAVSEALAYAKQQHARAWFARGNDDFVLLGTFRAAQVEPARSS